MDIKKMDHSYARGKLTLLLRDLEQYTAGEFWREMSRIASGASKHESAEQLKKERDELREKLAALESQEPYGFSVNFLVIQTRDSAEKYLETLKSQICRDYSDCVVTPVYARPVPAQPAEAGTVTDYGTKAPAVAVPHGWHIEYNPKPIPDRNHDYDFWHDDYDGADGGNGLCGTAKSLNDAKSQIARNFPQCFWCLKHCLEFDVMEGITFCSRKCEGDYYGDRNARSSANRKTLSMERREAMLAASPAADGGSD